MSYILAIDTSTDACSAALLTPEGVFQSQLIAPREHTQRLLPSIDTLLQTHSVSLTQLEAIAFGVGPGSFTGLRIALSTAQGLAYGADLPLLPVSTLTTMAHTAKRLYALSSGQRVIPSIDARMNEIYWCAYQLADSGELISLCEEVLSAPAHLAQSEWLACAQLHNQAMGVGSGWQYDVLADKLNTVITAAYPEAYDMAQIAKKLCDKQGESEKIFVSPLAAVPIYMRNEISWKKRTRIRDQGV